METQQNFPPLDGNASEQILPYSEQSSSSSHNDSTETIDSVLLPLNKLGGSNPDLLDPEKYLKASPYFNEKMSKQEAEDILKYAPYRGEFIVRGGKSVKKIGEIPHREYVLSMAASKKIEHLPIYKNCITRRFKLVGEKNRRKTNFSAIDYLTERLFERLGKWSQQYGMRRTDYNPSDKFQIGEVGELSQEDAERELADAKVGQFVVCTPQQRKNKKKLWVIKTHDHEYNLSIVFRKVIHLTIFYFNGDFYIKNNSSTLPVHNYVDYNKFSKFPDLIRDATKLTPIKSERNETKVS